MGVSLWLSWTNIDMDHLTHSLVVLSLVFLLSPGNVMTNNFLLLCNSKNDCPNDYTAYDSYNTYVTFSCDYVQQDYDNDYDYDNDEKICVEHHVREKVQCGGGQIASDCSQCTRDQCYEPEDSPEDSNCIYGWIYDGCGRKPEPTVGGGTTLTLSTGLGKLGNFPGSPRNSFGGCGPLYCIRNGRCTLLVEVK